MSIKRSQVSQSEEKLPLISERRQYPQVFRWKIAAIVTTVLIAVFLTIDIILFVKYNQNKPRKINYSFMIDILRQKGSTKIDFTKQQIVNMLSAFSVSFEQLWYKNAQLISVWDSSSNMTTQTIANFFLNNNNDQLLTFFQFKSAPDSFQLAVYTHIKFALPADNWRDFLSNINNSYYTFEIQNKQSVILGGSSQDYLKMSGGSDNLLNCKILNFQSTSIDYLRAINIDFSNEATPNLVIRPLAEVQSSCFMNSPNPTVFKEKLLNIIGSKVQSYNLSKMLVYHLSK